MINALALVLMVVVFLVSQLFNLAIVVLVLAVALLPLALACFLGTLTHDILVSHNIWSNIWLLRVTFVILIYSVINSLSSSGVKQ